MRETFGRLKASPAHLALWAALLLLLASLVSVGRTPTASGATPITVGGKAAVANTDGDPIRVRQSAGFEFAVVAMAYEKQTVSILDGPLTSKEGKQWFLVEAPGGTGWILADYLQGTGAPQAARLTGSARVSDTNGDPLRVRQSPSTASRVLILLNPGAVVTVQDGPATNEAGITWYKIRANGVTGWAMAQYLTQVSAPAEPAPTKAAIAEPTPRKTATPQPKPPAAEKVVSEPQAGTRSGTVSTLEQYRLWMEEARALHPYKQTIDKMWSVMMCESGGNPRASGGGGAWLGLFQYAPGTWGGGWNPYRGSSIWDARSQIFATAKAWSVGMQSHWSCYYKTAGR